jgi:dolichyl-diphosphooligosaccharide--protein glycosyltransferase
VIILGKAKKVQHTTREKKQQSTKEKIKKVITNEKVIVVTFLLIAIFLGTFFRLYPATLPGTTDWAEDTYYNQVRQSIEQQVQNQYPNLPAEQRNQFVQERFEQELATNAATIQPQIDSTAAYFKSQLQNENGQTYLLAIDPYVAHSYAKNYINNGHPGTTITDGKPNMELRDGREPRFETMRPHAWAMVQFHKATSWFTGWNLQRSIFFFPVIIIGLAIVCAFFVARRIAGNLAGLVAGIALGLNGALLRRTPAGFSDTDAYIIFFPLLVVWLFAESIYASTKWKKYLYVGLSGAAVSVFMLFWDTGWHIGTLILGALAVRFIYLLIIDFKTLKHQPKKFFLSKPGELIMMGVTFLLSSAVVSQIIGWTTGTAHTALRTLSQVTLGPLSALSIKDVAGANIWPNVLTTVAELNPGSWPQVIGSIGGGLFFFLGALGAILAIFPLTKKGDLRIHYIALLVFWFGGLTFAGILASRFIALLAAPFAVALGAFFGMLWILAKRIELKDVKIGVQVVLIIIVAVMFIAPIQAADDIGKSEIPSMNDGWHTSLTEIGADTEDGIITSWWDFGHWFVNVAEERVTFDGGDQGQRIYWVGKLLSTSDAKENTAILRMLNCGQNVGYERILEATGNNYASVQLINEIIMQEREQAQATLLENGLSSAEVEGVLEKTHCANEKLLDQYVIASEDMVAKGNVWAHFGTWDFDRAFIYNTVRNQPYDQALQTMEDVLGITDEEEAARLYFEANNLGDSRAVDTWISPWPGYVMQNTAGCTNNGDNITCSIGLSVQQQQNINVVIDGLFVDKQTVENSYLVIGTYQGTNRVGEEVLIPQKLTIWNEESTEWETTTLAQGTFPYEFIVGPDGNGVYRTLAGEDAIADSAFSKMFFFDGTGLDDYTKFSDRTTFDGQRIIVYKVNLDN